MKMKKLLKLGTFLAVVTLTLAPTLAPAFNPATHIYIADQLFPESPHKVDLYYGSTAPDIANFVTNEERWPTAFCDTHYDFIDLSSYAFGPTQKAFAKGWLTHNEEWGADFYAHIYDPLYYDPQNPALDDGYVVNKAKLLPIEHNFAHFAIEVAIDLLLKGDDPKLADKLIVANLLRSWQDRNLMVRVFVQKGSKTDWLTLAAAELTFRDVVGRYAWALSLPYPWDRIALVQLGMQLAQELYGIDASFGEVWQILEAAIGLCGGDYKGVIDSAIEGIKAELN
jgi:hypothetical protein